MSARTLKVAIADESTEYVRRLGLALHGYDNLFISEYSSREAFADDLNRKHFDVILCSPSMKDMIPGQETAFVCVLTDSEENGEEEHPIEKYQRGRKIYQNLLGYYAEVRPGSVSNAECHITAVYSPVGGIGKTTVAITTAVKLANKGKKTLYLNFEGICSSEVYFPEDKSYEGISEILSEMDLSKDYRLKIQSQLQTKRENLYYLNHFTSPNDLLAMTGEDMENLLTLLTGTGLFDEIVIDMNSSVDERNLSLFDSVDNVILVGATGTVTGEKMRIFLGQPYIMNKISSKCMHVLNFFTNHPENYSTDLPVAGRIPRYQSPDAAQLIDALAGDRTTDFLINQF